MKNLVTVLFLLTNIVCLSQNTIFKGYYVNEQGDTITGKVLYHDITRLQDTVQFQSTVGETLRFTPRDIRGFGIYLGYSEFEFTDGKTLSRRRERWLAFKSGANSNYFSGIEKTIPSGEVSRLDFESVHVDQSIQLFLRRENSPGGICYYSYYSSYLIHRKALGFIYTLSSTTLIGRTGTVIPRKNRENTRHWLSRVVSDYPLLSSMILDRQFSIGPASDIKLIIEEYNEHANAPQRTSPIFIGIHDANRLYSAKPIFLKTFAGTSVVLLPGLFIGGYYLLQPLKPVWPTNCPYCNDKWYVQAYRLRARAKKQKALDHAILYGFIVGAGVAVALAAGD